MDSYTLPTPLQTGDQVLLIAPGKGVSMSCIENACNALRSLGLSPILAPHLMAQHSCFAGTDEQRLEDLQKALDAPDIQAIYCVRGGYGCLRLIDRIDWSGFLKHPKWVIGYSDITVLHAALWHHAHCASLHAEMPIHLQDDPLNHQEFQTLWSTLQGDPPHYQWASNPLNRAGCCHARLIGGNLMTLISLLESPESPQTEGHILFIEEVGEALYAIDRLMWILRRSGKLTGLAGLIVGHLSDLRDGDPPFGLDAYQIIAQQTQDYLFPLAFGFPAGHQYPNLALTLGRSYELEVGSLSSLRPN